MQNIFIDKIMDDFIKIINKTNLTDKSAIFILRSLHLLLPIVMVLIMLIGSKTLFLLCFLFNIVVYILFYIFNGCILTILENKFIKEDFTIIDPFLELFNIPTINKNRNNYTRYSQILGLICMIIIYYIRFGSKSNH